MIVDELILKLQADLGDIKKSLKQVEADAAKAGKDAGSKMGKEAGTSFGDVFNAIAGAAVLNTVKGFFSKAAQEFNKMEAAMMRVDSIAKGFGRSVEVAKKQVNELADKGFLNLNQAASSYADAIALGFDEKQARKFIDSLSDIAAFQNTIGNGAEAVQSGLAGLLSNSAEKVENIGVPVKVLNQEYQKNIATMGKAAALQKFYNGILKESDKFQGDAARSVDTLAGAQNKYNAALDKAQVAIGQGLEPILKSLYATGREVALAFAEWFGKLNEGTKSIILVGAALVAIIPAFSAISAALAALSINPIVLMVTAVVAAGVAIAAITNQLRDATPKEIVKQYKEASKELDALAEKTKALEGINKRTISQELELIKNKEQLRERARALGLDYDALAAKASNYLEVTEKIKNAEREAAAAKIDAERRNISESKAANEQIIKAAEEQYGKSALDILKSGGQNVSTRFGTVNLRDALQARDSYTARGQMADLQRAQLYALDENGGKKLENALGNNGATEQRFLAASDKLAEIEKNRIFTILKAKRVKDDEERKRQIDAANEDAKQQIEAEFTTRRQAYAEFIEDKYMADTEALKKSTDDAIRASNEILEAELKKAKDDEWAIAALKEENEERLQDIKEANARKTAQLFTDSMAATLNAAANMSKGIQMLRAGNASGAGELLSGTGGLGKGLSDLGFISAGGGVAKAFSALGMTGAIIGGLSTLSSTIQGLFGKSDEQRAAEAAEQKQRDDEAKALLERQANYQRSMLALQEAAAKTPFESLQRNLRLIDIQAQKDRISGVLSEEQIATNRLNSRRNALQETLQSQAGVISQGSLFSGTGSSPEELTKFLNERASQSLAVQQFQSLIGSIPGYVQNSGLTSASSVLKQSYAQLQSYQGKIPDEIYNAGISNIQGLIDNLAWMESDYNMRLSNWQASPNKANQDLLSGSIFNLSQARGGAISALNGLSGGVGGLTSEFNADTSRADNLLSVLEQYQQTQLDIAGNTKKTAENTSKALELRPDRERSFIDVGLGYIQSLGQRIAAPSGRSIAASLSQQNFSIPAEIGAASVTSSRARTLQERMADALEMQLMQGATANDILRDIRALTYDLLAVMDGDTSTGGTFSQQDFINFSADVKRRRI